MGFGASVWVFLLGLEKGCARRVRFSWVLEVFWKGSGLMGRCRTCIGESIGLLML